MPENSCLQCATPSAPSVTGTAPDAEDPFQVPVGQLTFDAEGNEGGPYHSRRATWPEDKGGDPGVTIGRGYDMGQRSQKAVLTDLLAAGVPKADAQTLSAGARKTGDAAKQFVHQANVAKIQISPQAQKVLFIKTYNYYVEEVKFIFNKADTVALYGKADWESLHPRIRDVLVDLDYRGEYSPQTRRSLQPLLVANDLAKICAHLSNEDWMLNRWHVPPRRFQQRVEYLQGLPGVVPLKKKLDGAVSEAKPKKALP